MTEPSAAAGLAAKSTIVDLPSGVQSFILSFLVFSERTTAARCCSALFRAAQSPLSFNTKNQPIRDSAALLAAAQSRIQPGAVLVRSFPCELSAEAVDPLFRNLQRLSLFGNCAFVQNWLGAEQCKAPRLDFLMIVRAQQLSLRHLAALGRFTSLRSLVLTGAGARLEDAKAVTEAIKRLPLTYFSAAYLAGDDALAAFVEHKMPLTRLTVGLPATDKGAALLCQLPSLRQLQYVNCPLEQLPERLPTGLTDLSIVNCHRLKDLTPLTQLSHLHTLDLELFEAPASLEPLARIPRLTALSLERTEPLVSGSFAHVARCSVLRTLRLQFLRHVTSADIGELGAARMPSLTRLELAYCPRLSGACLSLLERLPRLQRLDLNRIDDVAGEHLRALEACTALRTIKVRHSVLKLTDADVAYWRERGVRLELNVAI